MIKHNGENYMTQQIPASDAKDKQVLKFANDDENSEPITFNKIKGHKVQFNLHRIKDGCKKVSKIVGRSGPIELPLD